MSSPSKSGPDSDFNPDPEGPSPKKARGEDDTTSAENGHPPAPPPPQEQNGKNVVPETDEAVTTPKFVDLYNVVKNILEHLPIRDVLSSSQVCRQWSDIGRIVRRQRKNCAFPLLYHPYDDHHKEAFEYFNGHSVSQEAEELVKSLDRGRSEANSDEPHCSKQQQKKRSPKKYKPNFVSQSQQIVAMAKAALQKQFFAAYDETQVLIAFGTSGFGKLLRLEGSRRGIKQRMKMLFIELQNRIPCVTSFSCGIIAAIPNSKYAKSLEMEKATIPMIACLSLPKIPGLTVRRFAVSKEENRLLRLCRGKRAVDKCKTLFGMRPGEENNLKAIVLLHKLYNERHPPTSPIITVIHDYLMHFPQVALVGGLHEEVCVSGQVEDNLIAGGFLIFGEGDSVRVASAALKEPKLTEVNRKKIEMLQGSLIPNGGSFAFMFACNGRGYGMHESPNAESDLFNSMLPNTPMIGAFTYGEFCREVVEPVEDIDKLPTPYQIEFAYTTVFLVVSFKHPPDSPDTN